MKNLTTSFARAAMLLLLAVFTTTPALATDYITDVIVLGHKTSEGIAALCTSYQNQGYTIILSELNSGLNNKPCIYLGYKTTSNPTAGSVITDFYIRGAESNVSSSTLTYNGHTYRLAQFAGDSGFNEKNGDLNYGAGGDYIHLFYTKEHFDDWRLVTGITFNDTQSGAIGKNGGTTGYDLNSGAGGSYIYMHTTTVRGPIFLQDATSNFTVINGDILTGTLDTENHPVKISIADGATVTLQNATINGVNNSSYDWAGITCLGNATIVLASGTTNIVKGFYYSPGIYIPQDKTLTIKGSGTLNVSSKNVGIGSNSPNNGGNIVIQGGTINATGGSYAPGIGVSGLNQTCGNITISGGTVNATGGSNAPGIGSCDRSTCGNITISGGTVNATGSSNAPGIGSEYTGTCGNISITTGVTSVTAKKGEASNYSIGAGNGSSCGTITIGGVVTGNIAQSPVTYKPSVNYKYTVAFNSNGGTGSMANQQLLYGIEQALRANTFTYYEGHNFLKWNTKSDGTGTSYNNGQSVSGIVGATANSTVTLYAQWNHNIDLSTLTGDFTAINGDILNSTLNGNHKISIANGATVTLRNVTINGSTTMTYYFAGINCLGDATIILEGTNDVKSFSPYYPCIYVPENKTLTIKGNGTLDANNYSNSQSAGIGGGARYTLNNVGYHQRGGNIVIEGGTINAKGGNYDGAGIGCGSNSSCGYILIKGGTINATGCSSAAGIGSCGNSSCGDISITTGVTSVEATMGIYASNSIGAGHQGTCGTVSIGGVETGNITLSPFVTYPYTVAFNANGGTGTMTNQILMYNVPQNLSNNTFTYTNSVFGEWNTQADGSGTALADGQNVSNLTSTSGATVTLYAQWQGGELVDGTPYKVTQDGSVTTATYTRPLTGRVGKHQAWFVPFDYEITSDDEGKFSIYKINMIANSPTPSQGATDEMWVFLKPVGAGTVLHANMPYVFKPKEDMESYSFTTANTTLKAKDTEVLAKMETMEDIYEVYGVYENTSPSASDPFYYVNYYGEISLGNSSSVTVGPYRWIIRKTSKFGGTTSYVREMHFFDGEEDDATGLNEELRMKNEESSEDWYTLDGVKLSGKPTQKGIYIHGGRKEAIR